ncbi:glutamate-rich WD repeat-containing protein 1 [Tanacetum coccineum]
MGLINRVAKMVNAKPVGRGWRDVIVAHFTYYKRVITSIEWSPHEASTLAVSSDDNQLTIWDLSLERDKEEEAVFKAKTQLGQKDLKELHWHTQIPGMRISTAADGFNIFMPSNIKSNLLANTTAA